LLHHAGSRELFENLARKLSAPVIEREIRRFPDGETYVRVESDVEGRNVVLFSSLDRPDPKFLSLVYTADLLRELGANDVTLLAPYLCYLRQDKRFQPGEAVTSRQFAELLDPYVDGLITVDPHLHRYDSLEELYDGYTEVLHAAPALAKWVRNNVENPYLIGPDEESEQWVSKVAERIDAPFNVLTKVRHGDRDVEIQFNDPADRRDRNPVLVDDIISTAGTMVKATHTLRSNGYPDPVCVGVHGVFAGGAVSELREAGARKIVTANSVEHSTNTIDLSGVIADSFRTQDR
jgi:ribose-phosphate pyrophosphokinase